MTRGTVSSFSTVIAHVTAVGCAFKVSLQSQSTSLLFPFCWLLAGGDGSSCQDIACRCAQNSPDVTLCRPQRLPLGESFSGVGVFTIVDVYNNNAVREAVCYLTAEGEGYELVGRFDARSPSLSVNTTDFFGAFDANAVAIRPWTAPGLHSAYSLLPLVDLVVTEDSGNSTILDQRYHRTVNCLNGTDSLQHLVENARQNVFCGDYLEPDMSCLGYDDRWARTSRPAVFSVHDCHGVATANFTMLFAPQERVTTSFLAAMNTSLPLPLHVIQRDRFGGAMRVSSWDAVAAFHFFVLLPADAFFCCSSSPRRSCKEHTVSASNTALLTRCCCSPTCLRSQNLPTGV